MKKKVSFNNIVSVKYYNKYEPIEDRNNKDKNYFIYIGIIVIILLIISLLQ